MSQKIMLKGTFSIRLQCFQTVVLEKTFESPMDCKEIKPGILKEINPAYSLEELILKWKLQYLAM